MRRQKPFSYIPLSFHPDGSVADAIAVDPTTGWLPPQRGLRSLKHRLIAAGTVVALLLVASFVFLTQVPSGNTILSLIGGPVIPAPPANVKVGESVEQCKSNPQGNVKILCEALKYDSYGYLFGGGHQGAASFVASFKAGKYPPGSSILDCSGLVGAAVYDAFGVSLTRVAKDYVKDKKHWAVISFGEARPGDLMYKLGGSATRDHVAIVYENKGGSGKLKVFEAWTQKVAYGEQIRLTPSQKYTRFTGALRYIGPGSR